MGRYPKHRFTFFAGLFAACFIAAIPLAPWTARGQEKQGAPAKPFPQQSRKPAEQDRSTSAAKNGAANGPQTFSSPGEASDALYFAARQHDENEMTLILGPGSADLIVWTDDPEIRNSEMDVFVQKYARMHRLVHEPDDETTLYVGAENWPLPIPIVEKNGKWSFDSAMGKREVLFRRIGENEMNAVETLHALVDAENEFYSQTADSSGAHEYASRLTSGSGKQDGLYWPGGASGGDGEQCPIGPYLAQADYDRPDRKPLHGYFFRVLDAQGPKAAGGARDYVEKGKMTGGFAFVAFPAEYRSSGVETFIVNEHGRVYEDDLGPMTERIAKAMKVYNPDMTWARVRSPAEPN